MELLGITPELNCIELLQYNAQTQQEELTPVPIFRKHERGIEIIVYGIDRLAIRIQKEGSRMKKNWSIIRLEKPIQKGKGEIKYLMPKGNGSFPFFPPALVKKYDNKEQIESLFLTEGFIKSFKASICGLDIVGVASITHLKNKEKGCLHEDILDLIKVCKVKRVIWLTDGDCLDLSKSIFDPEEKDKVDLYKRPASFYSSITTFKQLLDDYDVDKYFMHPDTDNILAAHKDLKREHLKGIDDILVSFPSAKAIAEIVDDAKSVSRSGDWFQKFNITHGTSKVRDYFKINNVLTFWLYQSERYKELKGKDFIFAGTKYRYDDEKGECVVIIPGDANKYFRVGDNYYKWIQRVNAYNQNETYFRSRMKGTILDDHGKEFSKHIPKFEDFINVPNHVNFHQVINSCFNTYMKLEYDPIEETCTEEDCPTIISYMKHLFGQSTIGFQHPVTKEKSEYVYYELGLDYIQLLYQRPTEKLPILCLVSKENNTGKSTFGNLLRMIFAGNVAIVGNADLAGDFNAHWVSKLVVACDETKIDKQAVVEKVKNLSTARKITMNAKGKDHVELDCFIKFIFITNNEENFIYATEEDIRYWVIKVPVLKQENPNILETMEEEIPAFLSFLNSRKLKSEKLGRMWFHPSLLRTEALKKVIAYSKPTMEKELLQFIKDMFLDFGVEEIKMSADELLRVFGKRYEKNYLIRTLKDHLKVDVFHKYIYGDVEYDSIELAIMAHDSDSKNENKGEMYAVSKIKKLYKVCRYSYPRREEIRGEGGKVETKRVEVSSMGRPYVFYRDKFLTPEEIKNNEVSAEDAYISTMTDNKPMVFPKDPSLPFE